MNHILMHWIIIFGWCINVVTSVEIGDSTNKCSQTDIVCQDYYTVCLIITYTVCVMLMCAAAFSLAWFFIWVHEPVPIGEERWFQRTAELVFRLFTSVTREYRQLRLDFMLSAFDIHSHANIDSNSAFVKKNVSVSCLVRNKYPFRYCNYLYPLLPEPN